MASNKVVNFLYISNIYLDQILLHFKLEDFSNQHNLYNPLGENDFLNKIIKNYFKFTMAQYRYTI